MDTLIARAHKWPTKYFAPAVQEVAKRWPRDHGEIAGATLYSLRRGMISLRIRAGDDRRAIAKQCGTSVQILERKYAFRDRRPRRRGTEASREERVHARQLAPVVCQHRRAA